MVIPYIKRKNGKFKPSFKLTTRKGKFSIIFTQVFLLFISFFSTDGASFPAFSRTRFESRKKGLI